MANQIQIGSLRYVRRFFTEATPPHAEIVLQQYSADGWQDVDLPSLYKEIEWESTSQEEAYNTFNNKVRFIVTVEHYPSAKTNDSELKVTTFLGETWFPFNSGDGENTYKNAAIDHIKKMREKSTVAQAVDLNKLKKITSQEFGVVSYLVDI
jgi:hypothetical protein